MENLTSLKFEPITPAQHVATRCNRMPKRMQDVVPINVGICCDEMLRLFGRGLSQISVIEFLTWIHIVPLKFS